MIRTKDKTNFKINDVRTWETNNCDANIAQYFTKQKKPDNDILSVSCK